MSTSSEDSHDLESPASYYTTGSPPQYAPDVWLTIKQKSLV